MDRFLLGITVLNSYFWGIKSNQLNTISHQGLLQVAQVLVGHAELPVGPLLVPDGPVPEAGGQVLLVAL